SDTCRISIADSIRASSRIECLRSQRDETVSCPGHAKTEVLLIDRSRLGGVSIPATRPPGRQHFWIVGLREREGDRALHAVVGVGKHLACTCDVAALDALGGLR